MADPVQAALEVAGVHTGAIPHDGPGRTDDVNMSVPAESFVVPADVVSALGQGNTAHGFKVLSHMYPPRQNKASDPNPVPVVTAGGEFVIGPEHVAREGGGDLKKGHQALKEFVNIIRKKHIDQLKHLKQPVMK